MGPARLYQHLRENGLKVTRKEAEDLLNCWLSTFPEMQYHFNSRPVIKNDPYSRYGIGSAPGEEGGGFDDDPFKEKRKTRKLYRAQTITGFVRNRATQNAACNCDFQNPVAHLAKEALWNLEMAGLGDRLFCFVHKNNILLMEIFMYKVYKWQNLVNHMYYVGVTKQASLKARMGKDGQGYRGSPRFYNAIKKYGIQNFRGQILAQVQTIDEAAQLEKHYIKMLDSLNPQKGYNLHQGGFPEMVFKDGDRRHRISQTLKKQRSSPEYRQIMRQRAYSFWRDPVKRALVIQKRKGKLTGRPAIPVYCLQTQQLYRSAADASRNLNFNRGAILYAVKKHKSKFPLINKDGIQYNFIVHVKESELLEGVPL